MIARAGESLAQSGETLTTPTGLTVVGLLGLVLLYFVRQMEKSNIERRQDVLAKDAEIVKLEAKVEMLSEESQQHRLAKHAAMNRVAVLAGQRKLARDAARQCTCGAMRAVLPLMEEDP